MYKFLQMAQIEMKEEVENDGETVGKPRPSLKAAIRLAEKEQQQLIGKIGKFHDSSLLQPIMNYDQQKTLLQKSLDCCFYERTKKILKSIKAQLSYLKCFQVYSQESDAPKEVIAIMKRDLDMLTAVISNFVYAKLYPKGSIIETVAEQRQKVRVLLRGEVAVFEPINYKSYKNCVKDRERLKTKNILMHAIQNVFNLGVNFDRDEQNFNAMFQAVNPEELEGRQWRDLHNPLKPLPIDTAKNILRKVNLITAATPHRLSRYLNHLGELICSDRHHFIIDQPSTYEHTAICLTECYVMQMEYEVYKQAITLLNSHQEKKYIGVLLRKFQMMEYFDAKQFVKKEYMIDKKMEEAEVKKQRKANPSQLTEFQKNIIANEGRTLKITQQSQDQLRDLTGKMEGEKQVDIQTYEIKYENDIYLIAEGEVTLQIDVIEETRLSDLQCASKVKVRRPRAILKLYQGDLFGFEEIGKMAEYNLTYLVSKDSKILLMSENVYIRYYDEIDGFRAQIKSIEKERNHFISLIIRKMQKRIDEEQFKRYQSVATLEKNIIGKVLTPVQRKRKESLLVPSKLLPPRQLQYLGSKQFEKEEQKLRYNIIKQKEGAQNGIHFQQLVQKGLSLKNGLSLASSYTNALPQNCAVVGNFIEVRDSKGLLLRRRSMENQLGSKGKDQSKMLRRIGVISYKELNDHNMKVIRDRKSKYKLEDFNRIGKEFKRLKKIATSLPKLGYLYSKNEELLYKNINKRNHQRKF